MRSIRMTTAFLLISVVLTACGNKPSAEPAGETAYYEDFSLPAEEDNTFPEESYMPADYETAYYEETSSVADAENTDPEGTSTGSGDPYPEGTSSASNTGSAVQEAPPSKTENKPVQSGDIAPKQIGDTPAVVDYSSYEILQQNYSSLEDLYNSVNALYHDDLVPQDNGVEQILNNTRVQIEQVGDLVDKSISGNVDTAGVLQLMSDITIVLNNTIDMMEDLVVASTVTEEEVALLNDNFEIVVGNYNSLVGYFNQPGADMTEEQRSQMAKASGMIDAFDAQTSTPIDSREDLTNRMNYVQDIQTVIEGIWNNI
ncbi:MAG: hypothetical protein IJT00_07810 [Lachnospiraceae bacterium]|nr:hypothetical protein [Lachnospiraceae bacterium]